MFNGMNDTIAAIATPVGESGIGIVRISGRRALSTANKIFLSKDKKEPSSFRSHTVHYGWIVEKAKQRVRNRKATKPFKYIDEVILTVMRKPRSYTREDVVEINCHAGIIPLRKTLELVLRSGVRLAQAGEFTKRAFLNGRIDLSQAEAVLDIIRAKTDCALDIGLQQLQGTVSEEINNLKEKILYTLALVEANIDFPEENLFPGQAIPGLHRLPWINARLLHCHRKIRN